MENLEFREKQLENLKEQLLNLAISKKISLINEINSWDGYFEHLVVYENDEYFFNEFFDNKVMEAVRATQYGNYYYTDAYVRFNGYGNLDSLGIYDFEEDFDSEVEEIAEWILDNLDNVDLDYLGVTLLEENEEDKEEN